MIQSFRKTGENKADAVTFDLDGKTVSKNDLLTVYGPSDVTDTQQRICMNVIIIVHQLNFM